MSVSEPHIFMFIYVCYREKTSGIVVGTESWKIGDVLLCLRSVLPVRDTNCLIFKHFTLL